MTWYKLNVLWNPTHEGKWWTLTGTGSSAKFKKGFNREQFLDMSDEDLKAQISNMELRGSRRDVV
jgi:hypothetical protein